MTPRPIPPRAAQLKRTPLVRKKQMLRGKPLKAKPRGKGNRGELAVVDLCKQFGWPARRNWMSGGMGGADIVGGPPATSIEVKWCERPRAKEWIAQCAEAASRTDLPIVACRSNATGWWGIIPTNDGHELLARRPFGSVRIHLFEQQNVALWTWVTKVAGLAGRDEIPVVRFLNGTEFYDALPLDELFGLLKEAES